MPAALAGTPHGADRRARRLVRRLVRRVVSALFLGAFLRAAAVGLVIAGVLVVLLRATHTLDPAPLLAVLPPLLAAALLGVLAVRRHPAGERAAATWLDLAAGGQGRLVTGLEAPDPRWEEELERAVERVGTLPLPALGRPLWLAAGAGLFLAAALLVRVPEPSPGPSPELLEALVAGLAGRLETLQENAALDEAVEEELTGRLEDLQELLGERTDQESLFEAIDALEERLGLESLAAREGFEETARDLAEAALDSVRDPEGATELLERALGSLRGAGLDEALPENLKGLLGEGLELPEGFALSADQLLELSMGLAELMDGKLENLAAAGLLDPEKLRRLAKLSDFLPPEHECDEECPPGGL